jgi:hypothetical protein
MASYSDAISNTALHYLTTWHSFIKKANTNWSITCLRVVDNKCFSKHLPGFKKCEINHRIEFLCNLIFQSEIYLLFVKHHTTKKWRRGSSTRGQRRSLSKARRSSLSAQVAGKMQAVIDFNPHRRTLKLLALFLCSYNLNQN